MANYRFEALNREKNLKRKQALCDLHKRKRVLVKAYLRCLDYNNLDASFKYDRAKKLLLNK